MAGRIEIEVTQGNLNNNHLYLRRHLDFFPPDAVGPPSLAEGQGRLLTIHFAGLSEPIETDIAGGNKLFLRDRKSWGRFYAVHGVRAGDCVTMERRGEYEYAVSPRGTRPAQPAEVPRKSVQARTLSTVPPAVSADSAGRFAEYRDQVGALSVPLTDAEAVRPELLLEREGPLEIYYAPMDWVRPTAKVAIVGITPGRQTMRIALETAAAGLQAGEPEEVFLDRVKSRASFSGMRNQLITWLDQLDLHTYLGVESSSALWTPSAASLLQPTSSVRYPVFKNGTNYSGSSPTIVRSPMLRRYVENVLSEELAQVPEALVVPLGKRVDEALNWLAARGSIERERVLSGFPHPSGANGHRHQQWRESHRRLRSQTATWFS